MNKLLIRNIGWIALIAVWSFLAGAYFNLGWVRNHSVDYKTGFFIGGIGMWIVFVGMGILVYRFAKNNGSQDPAKPALSVVSFFTVCFLIIASIKYNDVKKDKFVDDLEYSFVDYYTYKAAEKGLKITDLKWELQDLYLFIRYDLKSHAELEKIMQLRPTPVILVSGATEAGASATARGIESSGINRGSGKARSSQSMIAMLWMIGSPSTTSIGTKPCAFCSR